MFRPLERDRYYIYRVAFACARSAYVVYDPIWYYFIVVMNHSYVRVFESEGHTIVFEKALKDSVEYFKLTETYRIGSREKKSNSVMTLDGGYLYMDTLKKRGYVGYN